MHDIGSISAHGRKLHTIIILHYMKRRRIMSHVYPLVVTASSEPSPPTRPNVPPDSKAEARRPPQKTTKPQPSPAPSPGGHLRPFCTLHVFVSQIKAAQFPPRHPSFSFSSFFFFFFFLLTGFLSNWEKPSSVRYTVRRKRVNHHHH